MGLGESCCHTFIYPVPVCLLEEEMPIPLLDPPAISDEAVEKYENTFDPLDNSLNESCAIFQPVVCPWLVGKTRALPCFRRA